VFSVFESYWWISPGDSSMFSGWLTVDTENSLLFAAILHSTLLKKPPSHFYLGYNPFPF
jgi:hypothetical protein